MLAGQAGKTVQSMHESRKLMASRRFGESSKWMFLAVP